MNFFKKIILLVLTLSITLIAKDVATITGITGEAFIQRDNAKIKITRGLSLEEKDTVLTKDNAKVQIIFKDETIVTVGKNSNFSINEYLYEDDQEPVVKFSMLKGAMRTITGKIGKIAPEKFTVTAKTATIGIRGTNFSVVIGENDNTEVYCTFGAISVNVNGTQHIVNQGFFIRVTPDGKVDIRPFKAKELDNVKKKFAKKTTKTGIVNDDSVPSNDAIVDNTIENFDNIVIKDITDSLAEAELSEADIDLDSNLADVISGYTMNDALYNGTYNLSQNQNYTLLDGGDAKMEVDFGNDKITLQLLNDGGEAVAEYNLNTNITGVNFSVKESTGGSATGTFTGSTGNSANGSFTHMNYEGANDIDKGTFNVTSTQTLK